LCTVYNLALIVDGYGGGVRSLIGGLGAVANRAPAYVATTGNGRLGGLVNFGGGNTATTLRSMETNGTLFSVIDALASAVGRSKWCLYRKAQSGKPEDRVEVTSHAALDVWHQPNPFMTTSELLETVDQHYELTGEGWMVVSRDTFTRTQPLELWPVRPDRMSPIPHREKYLAGYEYRIGSETVPLTLNEVIFIRRPNPMDPYRGIGPVQSVLADVDSARYSAEWNRNFFLNSAEPGGIIEVPEALSDDEFRTLRTRWAEQHQGVAQAHRVAILEVGKWVDRKFSQRDMQFVELRHVSREIIREAFRVSKTMLGLSEEVNRATAQAAEYVFGKWLIVPRLERIKQALNYEFLPMFGPTTKGLEFDYESPVDDDAELENAERTSKVQAYVMLTGAGVTPAAAAEVCGLPDMEHEPKPEPEAPPVPPAPGKEDPAGEDDQEGDQEDKPADDAAPPTAGRKPGGLIPAWAGGDDTAPVQLSEGSYLLKVVDWLDDVHDAAEPTLPVPPEGIPETLPADAGPDLAPVQLSWETSLSVVLSEWVRLEDEQKASIVEQLRHVVDTGDVTALRSIEVLYDDGAEVLLNAMTSLATDAGTQVVAEAAAQGVEVAAAAITRAELKAWADTSAGTLADGMVMSAIREAIRVWGPSSTVDQVTTAVTEHLDSLTDAQTRYVVGGALTQAQHTGRERTILAGPSAALYADEVLDPNTCGPCRVVNRRWVGNSDDPAKPWQLVYPVRGYVACAGRDRCRGQLIAVWRGGKDWTKWIEQTEQRGEG
jgi:HK97 family phage portal protein